MKWTLTRNAIACITLGTLGYPTLLQADGSSPEHLVTLLKQGGYVIYMRHAQTESDYADQVSATLGDCSTQRVLSECGWDQAKSIGRAIAKHDIPISDVLTSEYCRAWQTADLAFGTYSKTSDLNFEPAESYSAAQVATMADRVRPLLVSGTGNRVIVGHDDPFEAVTGVYPEPQGVAFVLRTNGDGTVKIVGSIDPENWP